MKVFIALSVGAVTDGSAEIRANLGPGSSENRHPEKMADCCHKGRLAASVPAGGIGTGLSKGWGRNSKAPGGGRLLPGGRGVPKVVCFVFSALACFSSHLAGR